MAQKRYLHRFANKNGLITKKSMLQSFMREKFE